MAALQPDIQYVQFYTAGSAAEKIQRNPIFRQPVPAVKTRKAKRVVIAIDPVAVCGTLVAVFMLFAMGAGVREYRQSLQQAQQMSQYVQQLQEENVTLQQTYQESFDPEVVYEMATAIGMVPQAQAEHVMLHVVVPAAEPEVVELSVWDEISIFLMGLFA
jgi:hypothetical protein